MDRYRKKEKNGQIGVGAYGVVYRAQDLMTGVDVAMKKIPLNQSDEGVPATALREMILLKSLRHQNVVSLLNIVMEPESLLYLVFELVDSDLKKLMDKYNGPLPVPLIKSYSQQIFDGVAYCHSMGIMHRDIKPQNILVFRDGNLKIADFGLARAFAPYQRQLTIEVVTRWYRAPEILLGYDTYSPSVDVWSVGCVIAEMCSKYPLIPGDSDIDQIHKTFRLFGTPTEESWSELSTLPHWRNDYPQWQPVALKNWVTHPDVDTLLSRDGNHLMDRIFAYDPIARITASQASRHPWFSGLVNGTPPVIALSNQVDRDEDIDEKNDEESPSGALYSNNHSSSAISLVKVLDECSPVEEAKGDEESSSLDSSASSGDSSAPAQELDTHEASSSVAREHDSTNHTLGCKRTRESDPSEDENTDTTTSDGEPENEPKVLPRRSARTKR